MKKKKYSTIKNEPIINKSRTIPSDLNYSDNMQYKSQQKPRVINLSANPSKMFSKKDIEDLEAKRIKQSKTSQNNRYDNVDDSSPGMTNFSISYSKPIKIVSKSQKSMVSISNQPVRKSYFDDPEYWIHRGQRFK